MSEIKLEVVGEIEAGKKYMVRLPSNAIQTAGIAELIARDLTEKFKDSEFVIMVGPDVQFEEIKANHPQPKPVLPGTMEELKKHVEILNTMLNEEDPEWGQAAWTEAYSEHMQFIADYWAAN